jgi:hypothetical protein
MGLSDDDCFRTWLQGFVEHSERSMLEITFVWCFGKLSFALYANATSDDMGMRFYALGPTLVPFDVTNYYNAATTWWRSYDHNTRLLGTYVR